MFAQGQSFETNVIAATVDDTYIPLAAAAHNKVFDARILRGIPAVLSFVWERAESGCALKISKAGG